VAKPERVYSLYAYCKDTYSKEILVWVHNYSRIASGYLYRYNSLVIFKTRLFGLMRVNMRIRCMEISWVQQTPEK
jgi:hypothetical protein